MIPALKLQEVGYAFPGGAPVLESISLTLKAGERWALLGSNGAGKSTLLQVLAGLLEPAQGQIHFFGEAITPRRLEKEPTLRQTFRSRVGFLFQEPDSQLFCATVEDEVAFGPLQMLTREEARERTYGILHSFAIEHLAKEAPFALSGGEKRKVALASVLVMDPAILLLDEPTASLDAASEEFLFEWMQEFLSRPDKLMIMATHDLQLAADLSTQAAVLTPCHRLARTAATAEILEDTKFLRAINLLPRHRTHAPVVRRESQA